MSAATSGRRRPRIRRATLVIALLLLVPFLWEVYGAVSNLLFFIDFAASFGGSLNSTAWLVLGAGIAVPVVAFVVGMIVALRRTPGPAALVLLIAYGVAVMLRLGLLAYTTVLFG